MKKTKKSGVRTLEEREHNKAKETETVKEIGQVKEEVS